MLKNRRGRKILKVIAYVLGAFILLLTILFIYLVQVSKVDPPKPKDISSLDLQRAETSPGFYTLKNSWFRKSKSGLFELYVEGDAYERGVINGKLTKELVVRQEDHFAEQISKMVPSSFYRSFLRYFIGWFNRKLDKNVTEEYKEEIYGVSASASDKYKYLGTNYQRLLNYHAAHDIGHALQNLALVGCTSFATWKARSADSSLIIGRNFDFFVSDKFAEDKIVAFFKPTQGYKFMTVTWGGFVGAVSGMNEKGVTVTINAAKSTIPSGSATPVSLVAREVLQYARNIKEAIAIAKSRKMFVSESFLVGSAEDNKAVIIEKTPDAMDVYDPNGDQIVCANHFQSNGLKGTEKNITQMNESASPYRYERLMELLNANGKNTVQKTVDILRDRKGLHNSDIGMGNEKSINELLAHHSIVFEPGKLLVWVSASPWQLGQYIAYDLKQVFALSGMKQDREIADSSLNIAADTFLQSPQYVKFEKYRKYRQILADGGDVNPDSLVATNPEYYHTYVLAGDYLYKHNDYKKALPYYQKALTKVIATKPERDHILSRIKAISN